MESLVKPRSRPVRNRRTLAAGAIALAILATGCTAAPSRGDDASALAQRVEAARTTAEHEALAQEFDRQAVQARESADQHRALLTSYERGPQYRWIVGAGVPGGMRAMPRHCEQLIRNDEEDARIYAEMAAQHRLWAQQPPETGGK